MTPRCDLEGILRRCSRYPSIVEVHDDQHFHIVDRRAFLMILPQVSHYQNMEAFERALRRRGWRVARRGSGKWSRRCTTLSASMSSLTLSPSGRPLSNLAPRPDPEPELEPKPVVMMDEAQEEEWSAEELRMLRDIFFSRAD